MAPPRWSDDHDLGVPIFLIMMMMMIHTQHLPRLVFTMNSLNPAFHMTLSQMQILVDFSREFWQRFRKNVANIFLFSSETWMNITSNTTLT